jgi:hypothetical protein
LAEDNVILLASYPKTGSTWLKWMMREAVASGTPVEDFMPSFSNEFPQPEQIEIAGNNIKFVKTHLSPNDPKFGNLQGKLMAVISIYRHPLDVLLSSLNYAYVRRAENCFLRGQVRKVEKIILHGEMPHYINEFIENDGMLWYLNGCGRFSQYQRAWRQFGSHVPFLEFCYEDMVANRQEALIRLTEFMGLKPDAGEIESILDRVEMHTQSNGKFYWKRRAFNYEQLLPKSLSDDFNLRYKPVLDELGYGSATSVAAGCN